MQTYRLLVTLLLSTAILSACGIKGPLYLPDTTPPTKKLDKADPHKSSPSTIQSQPDTPFPDTIKTSE